MKTERGFTLIEVLVAAAVLGITASALFGLLSKSLFNLRKVEDLHRYELAAQDVMNRVLLLSTLSAPAVAEGTLDAAGARWTVRVTPWAPASLENKPGEAILKVKVIVSWPGRSSQRSIDLESLKEAKLDYSNYDLGRAIESSYPK
jgi:general secretion pathway protein I